MSETRQDEVRRKWEPRGVGLRMDTLRSVLPNRTLSPLLFRSHDHNHHYAQREQRPSFPGEGRADTKVWFSMSYFALSKLSPKVLIGAV